MKKGIEKYAGDAFFSRKGSNISGSSTGSRKQRSNKLKKQRTDRSNRLNRSHKVNPFRQIES